MLLGKASSLVTDLRDVGCEDGNWIEKAQDRVQCVAVVMMV
jgi:hypothetical protein